MKRITNLQPIEKQLIRQAVCLAMEYWPNSHLGDYSRRQDMRSAFKQIRDAEPTIGLLPAVYRVEDDAYNHQDM